MIVLKGVNYMKKLFRYLLVVTLLLSVSLSSVMALGSISKAGAIISWESEGVDKDLFEIAFDENPIETIDRIALDIRTPMGEVNNGSRAFQDYLAQVGLSKSLPENTRSVILIQEIRDLVVRRKDTKEVVDGSNVTVTWEVPSLVEGAGEVYIFHYSDDKDKFELINPINVDYVNKTVTAFFHDLCPVGVMTINVVKKPVNTNTVGLGMMLFIISAGAGALYILTNKKEA